jgi:hypothetical protein
MKFQSLVPRAAAALAIAAAASVPAQTAPSQTVPAQNAPVVTDVAPPPAEERSSAGAVVLEKSRVSAARARTAVVRAQRPATATMGAGRSRPRPADDAAAEAGMLPGRAPGSPTGK